MTTGTLAVSSLFEPSANVSRSEKSFALLRMVAASSSPMPPLRYGVVVTVTTGTVSCAPATIGALLATGLRAPIPWIAHATAVAMHRERRYQAKRTVGAMQHASNCCAL